MTSQKDIQSLIADIDSILSQAGSRPLWSKPSDAAKQRQVLERVRRYLVSQQQDWGTVPQSPTAPATPAQAQGVQQIVQAVSQEMQFLRGDVIRPLQAELEELRHQRESLVQEIRELEKTKQQLDSSTQQRTAQEQIISEFSQELINRSSETLAQQLAQLLVDLEAQFLSTESTTDTTAPIASTAHKTGRVLSARERLEQLRQLQAQSDQLLTTLDANQRTIFEALQRNLQSYQESLSQGLEKMHGLGVQGEMLFTGLVNRLGQQVEHQPSTLVRSPQPRSEPDTEATNTSPEDTSAMPLTLSADVPVVTATASPTSDPTESTPEDPLLAALDSGDEELDFENLDSESEDGIDTFIQLNIDDQGTLSLIEELNPPNQPDHQDLESWLDLVNEHSTTAPPSTESQTVAGEASGLISPESLAELQLRADNRRQEIEDLYESLFGSNALSGLVQPVDADSPDTELQVSEPTIPMTGSQSSENDEIVNADLGNPLSPQIEEVLFEGLADPATEGTRSQPLDLLGNQSADAWDALFFEDLPAPSSIEADLAIEGQSSFLAINSPSNPDRDSEREGVETIGALTDLFEEMGLTQLLPATAANSQLTTQPDSAPPASDPDTPTREVEDEYIPASPEEDLLATDGFDTESEIQIWLDQSTLQQLSEDLYSFEGSENQTARSQDEYTSPSQSFESSRITPQASPANPQNRRFPISEELLAEDWEEFALNDLSNEDVASQRLPESTPTDASGQEPEQFDPDAAELTTAATQAEILDNSSPVPEELVELDFDPDLFPSESLELDQEHAASDNLAEEVSILDDEPFIEMQWDEPPDSTTEEMTASPESEFDSNFFEEEPLDLELESVVLGEVLAEVIEDEEAGNEASNPTPGTTFALEVLDDDSDEFSETALDFEQQDVVRVVIPRGFMTSDEEILSEEVDDDFSASPQDTSFSPETRTDDWDQFPIRSDEELWNEDELDAPLSDSLRQEPQTSNESNCDKDLPASEDLNRDQADNPKKTQSDSDSDPTL